MHTNPDGTIENVYVIHDSAKVIDDRLTTASFPFPGIWGFGIFTFLMPAEDYYQPVVVSGYTYREIDEVSGYNPQYDGNGGYAPGSDLPIKGAIVRCPGAYNFIAYSNSTGWYATYGFTAGGACRTFSITGIHPQTMYQRTANVTTCDTYFYQGRLNFNLADKNTVPPDTTAPSVSMNMQVAPNTDQDVDHQDVRFITGTVPVGTNIDVPVIVIDQEMGTATLTVKYKTPDMPSEQSYSTQLSQVSSEIHTYITPDNPAAVYKYTYQPAFGSPLSGSQSRYFRPNAAGTYTFVLEARDAAGHTSTKSISVRAVQPGAQPEGIDGPPAVDEILPADGAQEIMVTMPIMVTFSEPVQNVNSTTFRFVDTITGQDVPASIYTSIEGGRMRATLTPKNNLMYGRKYEIVISQGITDAVLNPSSNGAFLPLDKEYHSSFTTKVPQVYDLPAEDQFSSGYNALMSSIALYTHPGGRTFAYVAAAEAGWRVVDVTDPTRPYVTYQESHSMQGVAWRYRGAAVEQQQGILALTDWIQYLGSEGNSYGYVRFYDLTGSPEKPSWRGMTRLADQWSGVPGRVTLLGNYAYVATINVGIQVVDVEKAKILVPSNPGAAIVGVFDTVNQGYREPRDIVAYQGGRLLLTTTSGHLLVLDVNTPTYPQLMAEFKPADFSAWSVAAAPEYAFTDESGNTQVMDIAVVGGGLPSGKVYTVNLTDPYNPAVLGVVKDLQGNPASIYATAITISKSSGLVYATASGAVYIIDIKDPYNPRLLNVIIQTPTEPGSITTTQLGYSSALVEKDGWVYLANQQKGLRVLDLDPVYIGIEETTPLVSKDYYPILGTKTIRVWGDVNGVPANSEWELCLTESVTNFDIGVAFDAATGRPADLLTPTHCSGSFTPEADGKGYMPLYIRWKGWDNAANAQLPPSVELKIRAKKRNVSTLNLVTTGSTPNASEICDKCKITIKHNGNVDFAEVMAGREVFVADGMTSISEPGKQRFDFVKELLNQVVPRKRTLTFIGLGLPAYLMEQQQEDWKNYPYHGDNATAPFLDDQNTRFDQARDEQNVSDSARRTAQALQIFRKNFGLLNVTLDKTSNTFKKLMKDYNKTTSAEQAKWLYQVVDQETLVGSKLNIGASPDQETGPETGLYELYENVVKKFIAKTIKEAERYAGTLHADTLNEERPKTYWVARSGEQPPSDGNPASGHGQGMSYCYGCRQTIADFNSEGTSGTVENRGVVKGCNVGKISGMQKTLFYTTENYAIDKASCTACHSGLNQNQDPTAKVVWKSFVNNPAALANYEGNVAHNMCANPASGYQKYPGLYRDEHDSQSSYQIINILTWQTTGTTTAYPQFQGKYWAGSDCSNLVQQSILTAKATMDTINSLSVEVGNTPLWTEKFTEPHIGFQMPMSKTSKTQRWLRRGDMVHYKGHMSLVHQDKPTCSDNKSGQTTCTYEIIHAYGYDSYFDKSIGKKVFSRKVIKTRNDLPSSGGSTLQPTGFGRIKLWD